LTGLIQDLQVSQIGFDGCLIPILLLLEKSCSSCLKVLSAVAMKITQLELAVAFVLFDSPFAAAERRAFSSSTHIEPVRKCSWY
jgi:hypothetical protein